MRSSLWNCASRASLAGDALGQELQRDRLIEREVVGAVHLAHAAAAEQRDQTIAAGDDGAGCEAMDGRDRGGGSTRCQRAGQRIDREIVVALGGIGWESLSRRRYNAYTDEAVRFRSDVVTGRALKADDLTYDIAGAAWPACRLSARPT